MITKENLKKSLSKKYLDKRLTDEALGKLTEIVYSKITEESTDEDVDTAIAGIDDFVSLLQSKNALQRPKIQKISQNNDY